VKFERTPQESSKAIYAFLVIAAAIIFASLWIQIGDVLAWIGQVIRYVDPVVYGLVMAFLFSPLLHAFDDKLLPALSRGKLRPGLRRVLSLLLTYLVVLIVVAAALLLILPQVIASLQDLMRRITLLLRDAPQLYDNVYAWVAEFQRDSGTNQILRELLTQVMNSMQGMLANVGEWLGMLVSELFTGLTGLASGITKGLLGLIISVYILAGHEKLLAQAKKALSALLPTRADQEVRLIARETYRIFSGYLAGAALDACIVGTVCFVAMSVFGWKYAVLTAVIIGLCNMVPFFGPFIGGAIGVLLQLSSNPLHALGFLIYFVIAQQLDANILSPRIVGSNVGLPPLWVVFGILLFSGLMGVAGMLVGVPLFAVLFGIARRTVNILLERKSAPTDLHQYDTAKNQLQK